MDLRDLVIIIIFLVGLYYISSLEIKLLQGVGDGVVRIIVPSGGSGLLQDAKIYQSLIPNSYIIEIDRNFPDRHPEAEVKRKINLYLEQVMDTSSFPSDQRWLMVNQEYMVWSYFDSMDRLLVKSRFAYDLLRQHTDKCVYLGHTSLEPENTSRVKDWNLFLHLAGASPVKNTRKVIKIWQKNRGFRDLNSKTRLVVTARNSGMKRIKDLLEELRFEDGFWTDPEIGLEVHSHLKEEEVKSLQAQAGVYLCPSAVEGYGHYINEGAVHSAVVMIPDFPPMNELIPREHRKIKIKEVIPCSQIFWSYGVPESMFFGKNRRMSTTGCSPDFSDLEVMIKDYLKSSDQDKEQEGKNNYLFFLERRKDFYSNLQLFLKEINEEPGYPRNSTL